MKRFELQKCITEWNQAALNQPKMRLFISSDRLTCLNVTFFFTGDNIVMSNGRFFLAVGVNENENDT